MLFFVCEIIQCLCFDKLFMWLRSSLNRLETLGHFQVHHEDLIQEHLDHLSLVFFEVRSDLCNFCLHFVLDASEFLVFAFFL